MSDDEGDTRRNYEHQMRTFEFRLATFNTHMQAVLGLASTAINSIILANSAAAGALLTFLAVMWGKPEFLAVASGSIATLQIFAVGITGGMLAAGVGYVAQYLYMELDMTDEDRMLKSRRQCLRKTAIGLHVLSFVCAIVGAACFPYGAWGGLSLLSLLTH
jgi:hypothetical protein